MTEMELDRICERCITGDCKHCMAFGEWWRTELGKESQGRANRESVISNSGKTAETGIMHSKAVSPFGRSFYHPSKETALDVNFQGNNKENNI